jgi:hypoxanthine phosphoribosyltransferase
MPARLTRAPKKAVRELGWAAFGEIARQLASRIAERSRPDLVLGIAKGGVFVGGAIAGALGADFVPIRVERRRRDAEPVAGVAELPDLKGRRVLVVDDVANTGGTLAKGRALARKGGAREVRTAVLVVRPGGFRPDYHALETDALVLFGWDYQLDAAGGPVDPGEVGV